MQIFATRSLFGCKHIIVSAWTSSFRNNPLSGTILFQEQSYRGQTLIPIICENLCQFLLQCVVFQSRQKLRVFEMIFSVRCTWHSFFVRGCLRSLVRRCSLKSTVWSLCAHIEVIAMAFLQKVYLKWILLAQEFEWKIWCEKICLWEMNTSGDHFLILIRDISYNCDELHCSVLQNH